MKLCTGLITHPEIIETIFLNDNMAPLRLPLIKLAVASPHFTVPLRLLHVDVVRAMLDNKNSLKLLLEQKPGHPYVCMLLFLTNS